jgi:ABC-type nitrate/sulfonate/bicarbonate transport system ATPase subunit
MMNIVELRGVSKTYNRGTSRETTAIRDVSFAVADLPNVGELIAIMGPSGCGKSTVLKLIAGLTPQHPPTTGEVLVMGQPVSGPGADRGMVFQEYTAFDNRTVVDNIAFGLECRGVGRGERREHALEWVQKVGLDPKRDAYKYPSQLSGGMRQRVAIARSLILKPRILLMDEPFGALDPLTRLRMQDLLITLWSEVEATVFFVTHSIEEGVFLGDRVYLFSAAPGTIVEQMEIGRPDKPAIAAQAEPAFAEKVRYVREKVAAIEEQIGIR